MNKTLKIWCTYHNENIPKEYNLYNTNNIQLFNNDIRTLKEDNINYLHDYLGEITTYYYVWKNQIKTDYIGICQYRHHFINIDYDALEKNGIQAYLNCIVDKSYYDTHTLLNDFFIYNFINYMYQTYDIDVYDYIFNKHPVKTAYHAMFIFRWDIFNKVCEFIFGFLDYLTNKKWKTLSNLKYLIQFHNINFNNPNNTFYEHCFWDRAYSVINEIILGMFVNIMYNIDSTLTCSNYCISLDDKVDNINAFDIWYKMNIKTGIINFYIGENNYNVLENITKQNNINFKHKYQFIRKLAQSDNIIKLKLNERIKCDDSIEFHKGNYTIEKFNNENN